MWETTKTPRMLLRMLVMWHFTRETTKGKYSFLWMSYKLSGHFCTARRQCLIYEGNSVFSEEGEVLLPGRSSLQCKKTWVSQFLLLPSSCSLACLQLLQLGKPNGTLLLQKTFQGDTQKIQGSFNLY